MAILQGIKRSSSLSKASARDVFGVSLDMKRCCDIAISLLALVAIAPLLMLVSLLIRLESPGPILFRQTRTGLNGRPFTIYKFRTMYVQENGPDVHQAAAGDARITCVGRILRHTSIDELPQLINVLRGDMSLIGPRPHAIAHDEYYKQVIPEYPRRFAVKPGITGWAQVNRARGPTPMLSDVRRRTEFDLWYVNHAGFMIDLRILALTVWALWRDRERAL